MIPYPVIPVAHLVEPDGVGKINFQRLKGTDSRRKYRPKASSSSGTFPPRQKLYNQTYVDGSWGAGTFVQDRIQIDSAPTGSSKPALASTPAVLQLNSASSSTAAPSATVTFLNVIKDNLGLVRGYEGQISGLLGLTRASATGRKTFLQELVQQGSLAQPVMSMHLGLDGGSFMIGGIDSTQYLGELVYSPVTDPITWRISLQGLGTLSRPTTCMGETTTTVYESVQQQETSNNTIGNDNLMKPLPQRNLFHDAPLIIDSGTSSILIPTAASQVIHGELFGTYDPVHKVWFLPCEGPDLVWWISSGQYGIVQPYESLIYALEDGRCQSLIFDNHLADYWILGDSWLRGLYLVYDMAGSGRIGIAEAIHSDAETSSEPTSSGPGLRTRILVYQSTSGGRPSFGANWTWSAVSSVACVLLIQAVGWSVYFP
ncbi:hypothetical protein BGX28_002972 [Mortierella sp. GBA30]|nr:hypothetical protein BGX28_002972 [Mortierella sp. GBA30]